MHSRKCERALTAWLVTVGCGFVLAQSRSAREEFRSLQGRSRLVGGGCGIRCGGLNLATKKVRWLSMEGRFALNGVDGLYFNRGRLIAVQNGTAHNALLPLGWTRC